LLASVLGTLATCGGTLVAWLLVPLRLGTDSWKLAAMLTGRHIGGAVNYVAIADATGVSKATVMSSTHATLSQVSQQTTWWLPSTL